MLNYSRNGKLNSEGDDQANDTNLIDRYRVTPFQASGPTINTQGDNVAAGFHGNYENFYKINGDYLQQGMLNGGSYLNVYGNDSASVYQGPSFNVIGQGPSTGKINNGQKPVKENADGSMYGFGYYPEASLNASGMDTVRENNNGEGYMNAQGNGIKNFFGNLFPNRQGSIDAKNAQKLADANLTNAEAMALMQPQAPKKSSALPWIIGGTVLAAAGVVTFILLKKKKQ